MLIKFATVCTYVRDTRIGDDKQIETREANGGTTDAMQEGGHLQGTEWVRARDRSIWTQTYVDFQVDGQLQQRQSVQRRVRAVSLGRHIGRRQRDEGEEEDGVQEHRPRHNRQQVVEVGEEEVVESITIAWDVAHVIEKDVRLPEAVRLIHQLADLVMLVVQRRERIVLAAERARVRLGERLDVLAHLLEAVGEDQADEVEVGHGEHVDARHVEDPHHLDGHPGHEQPEGVVVHVLVGRQRVQHRNHARRDEHDQVADDNRHLRTALVVVRVVLGRTNCVRLHLLHRDERHQPGQLFREGGEKRYK